MTATPLPLIDVDRLQLGMYVVLDVGWRNHPFALSSFTLRTEEQLNQLRSLGPRQVRYCPDRSTTGPLDPVPAHDAAGPTVAALADTAGTDDAPAPPATAVIDDPLHRQELSLRRVEAEYQLAAQRHQAMMKSVLGDPQQARRLAEQLGDSMLEWLAEAPELAVRLLSQRVGDPLSAHEVGVTTLALLLARECGFSRLDMQHTAVAALLHDIGKLTIPSFLHEETGKLTEFERRSYRRHVELGVELATILELPRPVGRAIAEHHERCDGSGFPAALRGDQMSPVGRVLAIANRYLRLVAPLRTEASLSPHAALQRMYGVERAHFDPVFLPRFVRIMGIFPPGTMVELTDRRMAIVIASRPGMSLSPRVQITDAPDRDEPSLAIDLQPDAGPRVLCSVQPDQLNPRWAQRARQLARSAIFIEPMAARTDAAAMAARNAVALA